MRGSLLLLACCAVVGSASAQTKQAAASEIVVTTTGALAVPWKEGRACTSPENCQAIIYHGKTGEIARFGEKWASDFAGTGRGKEVTRRETAIAKARKLKAQ